MKNEIKVIVRIISMVVISAFLGLSILCGIYALPTDGRVIQNAQASAITFAKEGEPFSWAYGNISGLLDNGTDSIMLRRAIFPGTGDILKDALQNPGHIYSNSNLMEMLRKDLNKETEGQEIKSYGRYWHGYLLYLRPLLFFCTVGQIRMLNGIVQLLLAFYLFTLIGEKLGKKVQWAFLLTYLSLNPISLAMSFQYSTMYYIMTLTSLWFLNKESELLKNSRYIFIFTAAGIGTAYFDFLTYPLVSYGIPQVLLLLLLDKKQQLNQKWSGVIIAIKSGLAWLLGYGGMYLSKWLLLWYFIGYDAFTEAIKQIAYRMSDSVIISEAIWGPELSCSILQVIGLNVFVMVQNPVCWGLLLFWTIQWIRHLKMKAKKERMPLKNALGIVAFAPFAWYMVLTNHSYVHLWFTFRELSIFIFAMSCYCIVKWQEYEK